MSQRDEYGAPINPNQSYEQYGANPETERAGFRHSARDQSYTENMVAGDNLRRSAYNTENMTDRVQEEQRYGADRRDDDMYGIGLGGGDRHHTPGDLETVPGVDSARRDDQGSFPDTTTTRQPQQQQQQQQHMSHNVSQDASQDVPHDKSQEHTSHRKDSMLGKVMEKAGGLFKKHDDQGHEKHSRG